MLCDGQSPYNTVWTVETARKALALPTLNVEKDNFCYLWQNLTATSREQFRATIAGDTELYASFSVLSTEYANLHGLASWPTDTGNILEEVFVESAPISHLVYYTDGRRRVLVEGKLLSFAEFNSLYGVTVEYHIQSVARDRLARAERALHLLTCTDPFVTVASVMASKSEVGPREVRLVVYDLSQVQAYARRNKLIVCEDQPHEV